ncbi:PQQ-binding-like beta-propeller repeat protein [Corallincola spongiicola]|uniref:Pyrrolo-quinoline quinone repeat domain-containing protein n=1 Tax=Corallincola spongiicola TaxID=2520508 RepID=A0ABY1WUX4_9GAMM|nr:PQQ-binding-like beta-propeller repeat protein [Corallincola spongiicola]TAA48413.1 hypothetical protein EXY25_04100 [Corallincola spongiicola]
MAKAMKPSVLKLAHLKGRGDYRRPLQYGDIWVVSKGREIYAYSISTTELLWHYTTEESMWWGCLDVYRHCTSILFEKEAILLDIRTGEETFRSSNDLSISNIVALKRNEEYLVLERKKPANTLYCYDNDSLTLKWEAVLPDEMQSKRFKLVGERLIVVTETEYLCYRLSDGEILWRNSELIEEFPKNSYFYEYSYQDLLLIDSAKKTVGFDIANNQIRWRSSTDGLEERNLCLLCGASKLYFSELLEKTGHSYGLIYELDPVSGEKQGAFEIERPFALSDNHYYSYQGRLYLFDGCCISIYDTEQHKILYRQIVRDGINFDFIDFFEDRFMVLDGQGRRLGWYQLPDFTLSTPAAKKALALRRRFSDRQWQLLRELPFLVALWVNRARDPYLEGSPSMARIHKENMMTAWLKTLKPAMREAKKQGSLLLKETLDDLLPELPALQNKYVWRRPDDSAQISETLTYLALLDDETMANGYREALLAFAAQVPPLIDDRIPAPTAQFNEPALSELKQIISGTVAG